MLISGVLISDREHAGVVGSEVVAFLLGDVGFTLLDRYVFKGVGWVTN